jgi:hypothetical protein
MGRQWIGASTSLVILVAGCSTSHPPAAGSSSVSPMPSPTASIEPSSSAPTSATTGPVPNVGQPTASPTPSLPPPGTPTTCAKIQTQMQGAYWQELAWQPATCKQAAIMEQVVQQPGMIATGPDGRTTGTFSGWQCQGVDAVGIVFVQDIYCTRNQYTVGAHLVT